MLYDGDIIITAYLQVDCLESITLGLPHLKGRGTIPDDYGLFGFQDKFGQLEYQNS